MIARLLTGLALSFLLSYVAYRYEKQALLAHLGTHVAAVMLAHNVTDGAARWTDADGYTSRTARLTGTADPATKARIAAEITAHPGIHAAVWR